MRFLFVLKQREKTGDCDWTYGGGNGQPLSSGLYNSARMVVGMLQEMGHEAKLVHVHDGNQIHRECVAYKPTVCVIEAFWCPPYKFDDLYKALPQLRFIVRNHSETPFLANEGIAFGWMLEYLAKPNVFMAPNSRRMEADTQVLVQAAGLQAHKVLYLPNYYELEHGEHFEPPQTGDAVDIGCFGAIRPLKNTMMQAVAAIAYADKHGKALRFHVNGDRIEGGAAPIIKNLRQVFAHTQKHKLIEHDWCDADEFKAKLKQVDAVMQASFSETFNIVGADATDMGVPVIGSDIPWLTHIARVDPNSLESMVAGLETALGFTGHIVQALNRRGLRSYNEAAMREWARHFGGHTHSHAFDF